MKKFLLLLAFAPLLIFAFVSAHQPRITRDQTWIIQVNNPEISQAFYGELRGQPDIYQITSDTWFLFYVNIVVPALPDARKDFKIQIFQWDMPLAELDGTQHERTEFYEHFAGDLYYRWPSFERQVSPGTYTVTVTNPEMKGKYSLAIGKIESFPGAEIVNTFKLLPALKTYFFDKPVLTMFYNYIWLALGIMIVVLALLILLARFIVRKIR